MYVLPASSIMFHLRFDKGDSNESFGPEVALNMQEQLVNVRGGAKLYFIRGTCFSSHVVQQHNADIYVPSIQVRKAASV